MNADEVGANVVKIEAKVNCHHHTFTCRKYCIKCRFNFPKYPMWKTIISRPRTEDKATIDKFMATLNKVKTVLECPEVIASTRKIKKQRKNMMLTEKREYLNCWKLRM